MAKLKFDLSRQFEDPRELPAYGIPQAAHYLRIPPATLRYWVLGKNYATGAGGKFAPPVISLPDSNRRLLSFWNLAEAHVLRVFRKENHIHLQHIRRALDYVATKFGKARPLVQQEFKTDGARLFVAELGKLIDASGLGQTVMPEMMDHLERLEFEENVVARLYPFTRRGDSGPKTVFIDPRFSFGRPVLAQINIATAVIAERYEAGESVSDLAHDYGCEGLEIEEAIRCELVATAA